MSVHSLVCDVAADVSRQVEDFVLALVVVWWWLYEEVLVGLILRIVPIVPERWEVVVQYTIAVVLSYASKLDHAIHLLRVRKQVPLTQKVLKVLAVEFKWLLCLIREPRVLRVLFPVAVLVYDEGWNQSHDWLE